MCVSKKFYKYSLCINDKNISNKFAKDINLEFKDIKFQNISDHMVVTTSTLPQKFISYLQTNFKDISLVGYGKSIEIFKQVGNPKKVIKKFKLEKFSGSHAIGHTRMATESAITV